MKRIILTAMALILALALCACKGNSVTPQTSNDNTPTQTPTSAPTQAPTEQAEDGRGDFIDESVPDGADVMRQGVYYYELYTPEGDPGEGLTAREGAVLTDELLASIGFYSDNGGMPAGQCVFISFDELAFLDSAMGRECYLYSVGIGTPDGGLMGDGYEVVYRVSVDYSGNKKAAIYEDYSGDEYYEPNDAGWNGNGSGDFIGSDSGDANQVEWWGIYKNVDAGIAIEISQVTATEFWVDILQFHSDGDMAFLNGLFSLSDLGGDYDYEIVQYGWAEIESDNPYFAMLGSVGLSMSEDYSYIDVFASESSEWANMRGQYTRN